MRLKFEYSTQVSFNPSIGRHNLLLRCLPAKEAFQKICLEHFEISEGFWAREGMDGYGNRVISAGTNSIHAYVSYMCSGVVETTTYCIPDAFPHPIFSLPSALTSCSKEMLTLWQNRRKKNNCLDDCRYIADAIHRYMVYTPGVTNMLTTAEDAYRLRKGVCQDFAHTMVALCRAIGYPSRYACGLMSGEGKTHAWVEVYDGQCWYAFDPTNNTAVATGYIKLAHGRDALDCPVCRGTYLGITQENTTVNVKVATR